MPVEFDLVVDPAKVFDFPGLKDLRKIAGSVDAFAAIVDELFGREFFTLQITCLLYTSDAADE